MFDSILMHIDKFIIKRLKRIITFFYRECMNDVRNSSHLSIILLSSTDPAFSLLHEDVISIAEHLTIMIEQTKNKSSRHAKSI